MRYFSLIVSTLAFVGCATTGPAANPPVPPPASQPAASKKKPPAPLAMIVNTIALTPLSFHDQTGELKLRLAADGTIATADGTPMAQLTTKGEIKVNGEVVLSRRGLGTISFAHGKVMPGLLDGSGTLFTPQKSRVYFDDSGQLRDGRGKKMNVVVKGLTKATKVAAMLVVIGTMTPASLFPRTLPSPKKSK